MMSGLISVEKGKMAAKYASCYRCGRIFSLNDYSRCPDCRAAGQAIGYEAAPDEEELSKGRPRIGFSPR
jgi:rRNA maturation endonuclease Nob1